MLRTSAIVLSLSILLGGVTPAGAHCDGLDGPVVSAARQALAGGNLNPVLIWVQPGDEGEIRKAFERTLAVRNLSPQVRDLADTYFFETVVRLHRAGEGAPYTGLKPAGRDLDPAVLAADKAIQSGSVESLAKFVTTATLQGIRDGYQEVATVRDFSRSNVSAGREYVKAYVRFLHYVEGIQQAVRRQSHEHSHDQ